MKVLTLDKNAFDAACLKLASEISKDYQPIALVGIVTGGAVVAKEVYHELQKEISELRCFKISASRSSTVIKRKSKIKYFFRVLPSSVLNYLRMVESIVLRFYMKFLPNPKRHVQLNDELYVFLKEANGGCVCVIDDAVDSGATITCVLAMLKEINSVLEYKVVSLVVTQKYPAIYPDVFLYDKILIRFPWSNDFKND